MNEPVRPFTRLTRRVLVDNRWHRYCLDEYLRRDGTRGEYYYVDMPGSCGTVPLFADGSTVLLRVRRYLLGRELWEFPIGGMKPGEDPLAVAQHELEEEAGLRANTWTKLGQFAPYKGVSNEVCHFWLAEDLTETAQKLEPEEDIAVHRMPLPEARRLLLDQDLGDGQSMVGLMLLDRVRGARGGGP